MDLVLEISQLELLKELQHHATDRDSYQRLTTLLMIHQKYSAQQISDCLGIDKSTVHRHYHLYTSCPNFESFLEKHYKPCLGRLTSEQLAQVKIYVQTHLCQTSLQVLDFIKSSFAVTYRPDSVIALLHRLGFVYKLTRLVPSKADLIAQEEFIVQFKEQEKSLPADEVILFGDGVHPHHNTESSRAWIEKGQEVCIPSNTGRVRVNINGAINPANPIEVVSLECPTIDALTTIDWLKLIEKRYEDKTTIHLYVDNARYYRSKIVQEYLQKSTIKFHFLPPYSPNLNPIERLWKFMKNEVIKSSYTPDPEVFKQRIKNFFKNIEDYEEKLKTLITTNFQKLSQVTKGVQTSMR